MSKESFQNALGEGLRQARRLVGTSQSLAALAGLTRPTFRLLEKGSGTLGSFLEVLAALDLKIAGRNLPPADSIGQSLALLRKRRGISQRALATLIGVSPPSIVSLETRNAGRLATLEKALTALGAGHCLMPSGKQQAFYASAGNSSVDQTWTTPQSLLQKLYPVFGGFDLDPCSPTKNRSNAPVQAKIHFTVQDDGLSLPWRGHVFVNPPYSRQLPQWIAKAREEVEQGRASTVTALIPARTCTHWWHEHVAGSAYVVLLRGRLKFGGSNQSAPFPSALAIWGADDKIKAALQDAFSDAWHLSASAS